MARACCVRIAPLNHEESNRRARADRGELVGLLALRGDVLLVLVPLLLLVDLEQVLDQFVRPAVRDRAPAGRASQSSQSSSRSRGRRRATARAWCQRVSL